MRRPIAQIPSSVSSLRRALELWPYVFIAVFDRGFGLYRLECRPIRNCSGSCFCGPSIQCSSRAPFSRTVMKLRLRSMSSSAMPKIPCRPATIASGRGKGSRNRGPLNVNLPGQHDGRGDAIQKFLGIGASCREHPHIPMIDQDCPCLLRGRDRDCSLPSNSDRGLDTVNALAPEALLDVEVRSWFGS